MYQLVFSNSPPHAQQQMLQQHQVQPPLQAQPHMLQQQQQQQYLIVNNNGTATITPVLAGCQGMMYSGNAGNLIAAPTSLCEGSPFMQQLTPSSFTSGGTPVLSPGTASVGQLLTPGLSSTQSFALPAPLLTPTATPLLLPNNAHASMSVYSSDSNTFLPAGNGSIATAMTLRGRSVEVCNVAAGDYTSSLPPAPQGFTPVLSTMPAVSYTGGVSTHGGFPVSFSSCPAYPSSPLHPPITCRTGEGGYMVGARYVGRVKRYNPQRGFGFLTATHILKPYCPSTQSTTITTDATTTMTAATFHASLPEDVADESKHLTNQTAAEEETHAVVESNGNKDDDEAAAGSYRDGADVATPIKVKCDIFVHHSYILPPAKTLEVGARVVFTVGAYEAKQGNCCQAVSVDVKPLFPR